MSGRCATSGRNVCDDALYVKCARTPHFMDIGAAEFAFWYQFLRGLPLCPAIPAERDLKGS